MRTPRPVARWSPSSLSSVSSLSRWAVLVAAAGLVALSGLFLACPTGAETPNAYALADAGAPGDEGRECRSNNGCNTTDLICIDEDTNVTGDEFCRKKCDPTDLDPCGRNFTCATVQGSSDGACVPAGSLGDTCGRCDEGLVCESSTCKATCLLDGSDGGCDGGATCTSFGDPTTGFCP